MKLRIGTIVLGLATVAMTGAVNAQTSAGSGQLCSNSSNAAVKSGGANREYKRQQFGPWLIEPSVSAGAVYDSNIYGSRKNTKSAVGLVISPDVKAFLNTGLSDTAVTFKGDAKLYSDQSDANAVSARLGVSNCLELSRDMSLNSFVQAARQQDDAGAYNSTGQGDGSTAVYVKPISSNSAFLGSTLLKRFDPMFVSVGGSGSFTRFDDASLSDGSTISQAKRDANVYNLSTRVGYNFSRTFFGFTEIGLNRQDLVSDSQTNSEGYRVTAGLGADDEKSLFRGEVFAGYMEQRFTNQSVDNSSSPVFGGRLAWLPMRDLTLTVVVDRNLGLVGTTGVVGSLAALAQKSTSVTTSASYAFDQRISSEITASYANVEYLGQDRTDHQFRFGGDLTYMTSANLGVKIGYTKINIDSNIDANSVSRDIVMASLNGRF